MLSLRSTRYVSCDDLKDIVTMAIFLAVTLLLMTTLLCQTRQMDLSGAASIQEVRKLNSFHLNGYFSHNHQKNLVILME